MNHWLIEDPVAISDVLYYSLVLISFEQNFHLFTIDLIPLAYLLIHDEEWTDDWEQIVEEYPHRY